MSNTSLRCRRVALAGLLLVPAAGVPAAKAQTPAQRTVIQAFRDSLDRIVDSAGLARLETRLVAGVRDGGTPHDHLKLGFLALRLGELGTVRSFEDAAMEFRAVTLLAPDWPMGWYGLGLSEFLIGTTLRRGGDAHQPARAHDRAATALARSAGADPGFVAVLVEEAHWGRQSRQPLRSAVALEALRRAARTVNNATVLQGLGQVEREYGDPAAALKAFEASLALSPRSRGINLLEVARTRFLLGRADGEAPYYTGATINDSLSVAAYREDIALIASPAELRAFDSSSGARRTEFLRRFWRTRDLMDFRTEGERLREHYRRLFVARRAYPRFAPSSADLSRQIASVDAVDDRGIVLIRHGEPDDRVNLSTLGFEPNESWRYQRAEGDLLLHFVARQRPDEFQLVESLFDVADARSPTPRFETGQATGDQMLRRSRERLSPVYNAAARRDAARARALDIEERAMGRSSLQTALRSDSYRSRHAIPMPVTSSLTVLGRDGDRGLLHLAYEIPFQGTAGAWLGTQMPYPVRFRLVALASGDGPVVRVDSLLRPSTRVRAGRQVLTGVVSVALSPGEYQVRAAFEDGRHGTVLGVETVVVSAGQDGLGLSDLAIAGARSPWSVRLDGQAIGLDAQGELTRGSDASLVVAVDRADPVALSGQLLIIRIDREPGIAVREEWSEPAAAGQTLVRRPLAVDQLRPGDYRAEVTVRGPDGELVRRSREFTVR